MAGVLETITERSRVFLETFTARGDYMAFYTDDCRLYPPGQETAIGKEAVTAAIKELEKRVRVAKFLRIAEFIPLTDDLAWVNCEGEFFDLQGKLTAFYKDNVMWRRMEGVWYMCRDIWNERPAGLPK